MRVSLSHWRDRLIQSDLTGHYLQTLVTRLLVMALGLVAGVAVARLLGPEGRGQYAIALAVGAIGVQFGNLGLHAANTYFLVQNRALLAPVLANSLAVSLGLGVLLAGGFYALSLLVPDWMPLSPLLTVLTLAWIPVGIAGLLLQNLHLGLHQIDRFNRFEWLNKTTAIGLIAVLIGLGATTPESTFAAAWLAMLLASAWSCRHLVRDAGAPIVPNRRLLLAHLPFGLKSYLSAIFGYLVLRADLLMIQALMGPDQAGFYAVATGTADLLYVFSTVMGQVLFPKLTALSTNPEKWRLSLRVGFIVGLGTLGLAMLSVLLAPWLIPLLFGPAFTPAIGAFSILAIAMAFYAVNNVFSQGLSATGLPWSAVAVWPLGLLLNVLLNLQLIPHHGIQGAAVASMVCYAGVMLVQGIIFSRRT